MTTKLSSQPFHALSERHVEGLGEAVMQVRLAEAKTDLNRWAVLAGALTLGVLTGVKKSPALGVSSAAFLGLCGSSLRDHRDVSEQYRNLYRLLSEQNFGRSDDHFMLSLALIDIEGLVRNGSTKPASDGRFTALHHDSLILGVSQVSKQLSKSQKAAI